MQLTISESECTEFSQLSQKVNRTQCQNSPESVREMGDIPEPHVLSNEELMVHGVPEKRGDIHGSTDQLLQLR
jgi:hypothetical protein